MRRISGFDGIRGLAALSVVFTHLHIFVKLNDWEILPDSALPLVHGGTGVQAFFILSGFLITYLLIQEHRSKGHICVRSFFVRRSLRILPLYFICVIPLVTLSRWHETGVDGISSIYALAYIYNFIPAENYANVLGHTWTLAVEEHFYLLWPFIFAVLFRERPRGLVSVLIVGIFLSHGLQLLLTSLEELSSAYFIDRWTFIAGRHIAFGCLAALLLTEWASRWRPVLGARSALAVGIAFYASSLAPGLPHDVIRPYGIGLLIFWVFLNQSSRLTRALEFAPLVYLGTISYGIYMYQGVLLGTGPYRRPEEIWPPSPEVGLLLLCLLAPLSHRWVETPLLRLKHRFVPRRSESRTAVAG